MTLPAPLAPIKPCFQFTLNAITGINGILGDLANTLLSPPGINSSKLSDWNNTITSVVDPALSGLSSTEPTIPSNYLGDSTAEVKTSFTESLSALTQLRNILFDFTSKVNSPTGAGTADIAIWQAEIATAVTNLATLASTYPNINASLPHSADMQTGFGSVHSSVTFEKDILSDLVVDGATPPGVDEAKVQSWVTTTATDIPADTAIILSIITIL